MIAERIPDQLKKESIGGAKDLLRFTASFGFAIGNASDADWKSIYARADSALNEAKAAGKDRIVFGKTFTPGAANRAHSSVSAATIVKRSISVIAK